MAGHCRPLIAVFVAAGLAGGAARAATYSVIRSSSDAVTVLDPAAAETLGDGQTRRVQIVRVQKSITAEGPPLPGYVATLTDYDCSQWRYRWRGFTAFSRGGQRLLHKDNDDPRWNPIGGDFEALAAARIVCDGHAAGSVYAADSLGGLVGALMGAWDGAAQPAADRSPPPAAPLPAPRRKPFRARP